MTRRRCYRFWPPFVPHKNIRQREAFRSRRSGRTADGQKSSKPRRSRWEETPTHLTLAYVLLGSWAAMAPSITLLYNLPDHTSQWSPSSRRSSRVAAASTPDTVAWTTVLDENRGRGSARGDGDMAPNAGPAYASAIATLVRTTCLGTVTAAEGLRLSPRVPQPWRAAVLLPAVGRSGRGRLARARQSCGRSTSVPMATDACVCAYAGGEGRFGEGSVGGFHSTPSPGAGRA
uniref:Uncharacterized protein n=1 Tax=Zea mays TaxID=4577 RepID=A0A804PZ05_MAIZE